MIDPGHPRLSIVRQCELAAVSRATFYRTPAGESAERSPSCGLSMRRFWNAPSTARARWFAIFAALEGRSDAGASAGGCEAHPAHKTYPYLLRKLLIERPNHVWCADVTYIPMRRGFLYLVAVMDWATRKVLAWRLSNTMEADFCVAALKDAMDVHGRPEIFNTDQGSQFTGHAFTGALADAGIRISMDGRGRWMDNVFIERLWRSLKYECVFLNAFETGGEAQTGIGRWIDFYNQRRPHSALGDRTPDEAYAIEIQQQNLAA